MVDHNETNVTDRGVAELKRATNLERIDLTNTRITENVVRYLKDLSKLRSASIICPMMTSKGYDALAAVLNVRASEPQRSNPLIIFSRLPADVESAPSE